MRTVIVICALIALAYGKGSYIAGCKRLDVDASFEITVSQDGEEVGNYTLSTSDVAYASSTCETAALTITFNETDTKWSLQFTQSGQEANWLMILSYTPTKLFPGTSITDATALNSATKMQLSAMSKSYKCMATQTVTFATYNTTQGTVYDVTLTMSDLQVQAYNLPSNDTFSDADECAQDSTSSLSTSTASTTTETSTTTESTETTSETSTATTSKTSAQTTTTPMPIPDNTYIVKDDNGTCIILEGEIKIKATYETVDNETKSVTFDVPKDAKSSGVCARGEETVANLTITFGDNTLDFTFMDDGNNAEIKEFSLTVKLEDPTFPNASKAGDMVTFTSMAPLPLSEDNTFFECENGDSLKLSADSELDIMALKVQAFGLQNDTFSGNGQRCAADATSTSPATTATTPTPKPAPKVNNFSVAEGNNTCLLMQGAFILAIKYTTKDGTNKTVNVDVPAIDNSAVTGMCGETAEELTFTFFKNWNITMAFKGSSSLEAGDLGATDNYALDNVTVTYVYDDNLPDAKDTGSVTKTKTGLNLYSASTDSSYKCNTQSKVEIDNVEMEVTDFRYQAFQKGNETTFNSKLQECEGDIQTNSIVPIAVGAALAGLVVIVLIAYLIGRRKSRRAGYESV